MKSRGENATEFELFLAVVESFPEFNYEVDMIEDDAGRCEAMVAQFLTLDYYGRGAVEDLIKSELDRCKAQKTTMDPNNYQIVVRSAKKKVPVK